MDTNERKYLMLGLKIVGEFGAIIAVPIVLFALAGKWLDARLDTGPAFLIAGFVLASAVTGLSIVRKAKQHGKEYEAIEKGKK